LAAKTSNDGTIEVPEIPAIPGLTFRRFRGKSDYPQIAEVFSKSWAADGTETVLTAEDAERVYSNMKNFDPDRDFLMVEVAGSERGERGEGGPRLVGYGRAEWQDEVDGENSEAGGTIRVYWLKWYLEPEWRGRGIERALLLYYERHLGEIAASQEFAGPRALQSFVSDRDTAYVQALESHGYQAVRYEYEMVRPDMGKIPDLPMPEGLEVRSVQPEHLLAIWEAEVEAFRDHWGFSEPEEADFGRWLNEPNFQPHLWQVAWDVGSGQVAGMIRNYISEEENLAHGRQRGYTEWISVRRPWRRRGLARALLAWSLRMHKELSMTEAALSVDSQNASGALQLYESMGFRLVVRVTTFRKGIRARS
jgi:GNAT superfamily N-acetyltransferase